MLILRWSSLSRLRGGLTSPCILCWPVRSCVKVQLLARARAGFGCMLHVNSNSRVLVNIHIRFSKYIHSASALRRDMIEYLEGETWCMGACSTLLHSINRKFNLFESV